MCQTLQIPPGYNSPTISEGLVMILIPPEERAYNRRSEMATPENRVQINVSSSAERRASIAVSYSSSTDCRALGSNCPLWQSVEAGSKVPGANARLLCKRLLPKYNISPANLKYHYRGVTVCLQVSYQWCFWCLIGVLFCSKWRITDGNGRDSWCYKTLKYQCLYEMLKTDERIYSLLRTERPQVRFLSGAESKSLRNIVFWGFSYLLKYVIFGVKTHFGFDLYWLLSDWVRSFLLHIPPEYVLFLLILLFNCSDQTTVHAVLLLIAVSERRQ